MANVIKNKPKKQKEGGWKGGGERQNLSLFGLYLSANFEKMAEKFSLYRHKSSRDGRNAAEKDKKNV